jgi:hypothetical protein
LILKTHCREPLFVPGIEFHADTLYQAGPKTGKKKDSETELDVSERFTDDP